MQKMSPIPSFSVALDIHAGKLPVTWTVRDQPMPEERRANGTLIRKARLERLFWPQLRTDKWGETGVEDLEDPFDLRSQLFRAFTGKWSECAALSFLNRVGAWDIALNAEPEKWERENGTYAKSLAYRHRFASAVQVLPITLTELRQATAYWYEEVGLSGPAKHRKKFAAPPSNEARPFERIGFAAESSFLLTLPVSLEWQGEHPRAVIETLSATELLAAAAWAGVVAGLAEQVCARCNTRFTYPRMRKYCPGDCAHLAAVQKYKRKIAAEKLATKRNESGPSQAKYTTKKSK